VSTNLILKLLALCAFFAIALLISLASGTSTLVYSSVSRDKDPTGYWVAVGLLGFFAISTGGLAIWSLLGHAMP
jgi:hypothetical protein